MIDILEEQKYEQLRKLGTELHIPVVEAYLELEVRDKDGNIVKRHRQRSHSWVRNAYNLFFAQGCCGQTHSSEFPDSTLCLHLSGVWGRISFCRRGRLRVSLLRILIPCVLFSHDIQCLNPLFLHTSNQCSF